MDDPKRFRRSISIALCGRLTDLTAFRLAFDKLSFTLYVEYKVSDMLKTTITLKLQVHVEFMREKIECCKIIYCVCLVQLSSQSFFDKPCIMTSGLQYNLLAALFAFVVVKVLSTTMSNSASYCRNLAVRPIFRSH